MKAERYLIFNGDDFGASRGINDGILRSHTEGVLTSTSLMVNMPATEEAADLARDLPKLSVGIHVNFTNEGDDPVVDIADIEACRTELHRQFDTFARLLGRQPTHIDSQHNVHLHEHLTPMFRELADGHGLPLRGHSQARYFGNFYGQWDGETHLEHISPESLEDMLVTRTKDSITEIGCHPGYLDPAFESVYSVERETEIETLCSPELPGFLGAHGFALIGFADLA